MKKLLIEVSKCQICAAYLPNPPKPILSVSKHTKILIIGHAPGRIVHQTGIVWNDASGNELRRWLGVNKEQFYDTKLFGTMQMGFCYPGTGKSGDLAPRKECAPKWHQALLDKMKDIELCLLVGAHAQKYYLKNKNTLTQNVKDYLLYFPKILPTPHPSPRNRFWQKKNPWFENEVVPSLQKRVQEILNNK